MTVKAAGVDDLSALLTRLLAAWENEVVEFKQASRDYGADEIGRYFSALANEANLRGANGGWLVFGVQDRTRRYCESKIGEPLHTSSKLHSSNASRQEPACMSKSSMRPDPFDLATMRA